MALVLHNEKKDIVLSQASSSKTSNALIPAGVQRTSALNSPTMLLSGHEGSVNSVKFRNCGQIIASASSDKKIFLWRVYGECENYMMLSGHKSPILDLSWTNDSSHLFTASADKMCMLWDATTGERVRKYDSHTAVVNSCATSKKSAEVLASGSDDSTVRVWDARNKHPVHTLRHNFPVTSITFGAEDHIVYSGSIDNCIRAWDLRNGEVSLLLSGHNDTVTSLALSPDGSKILSNSMDNSVRVWDINPFVFDESKRCISAFFGAQHNNEKQLIRSSWSKDGMMIGSGSADRNVYVWGAASGQILYLLPGHKACVTDVDFHPTEPVIASASSDKTIFLGEFNE